MFSRNKYFLSFSLFALTSFSLAGCKSGAFQSGEPNPQSSVQPQSAPPPVLPDGSRASYADIVDRVAPAVVKVNVEQRGKTSGGNVNQLEDFFKNFPGFPQGGGQGRKPQIERGVGSGVIVSQDGTVLTNNHVIDGATKITVEMNDKRTFTAKVVGVDPLSDLAVIKIEATGLPFLNLGNSDQVRVGDIVLAIGNPLGIGQTVTSGIISAKGRRTGLSDGSFEDFLQTDAPINRGNSGGALINLTGELIGINSQILSSGAGGGSIGIGFSIPSNMAKSVMEQLVKDGKVRRGQLGVVIQNITEDLAKSLELKDTKGVLVSDVSSGGAAEKAGIKRGDIITAINGEKTEDSNILRNRVAQSTPGTEVTLTVLRDGKEQEFKATLGELSTQDSAKDNNPENKGNGQGNGSAESGKLGLNLQPMTPEIAGQLGVPANTKGLVVTDVDESGAAADAGISKGDIIQEIDRQPVETFDQVRAAIDKAGDKPLLMLISRGGRAAYITVQPNS